MLELSLHDAFVIIFFTFFLQHNFILLIWDIEQLERTLQILSSHRDDTEITIHMINI